MDRMETDPNLKKILGLLLKTLVLSKMTKNWSTFVFLFWLVKRTPGWKNFMPGNFLEIDRYFALKSYCNTIGQPNNAFSILGFSLTEKRRGHVLIFDKTSNEHLPKQFFKVIRKSLYLCFRVASMKRKFRLRIFRRPPQVSGYLWRRIFSRFSLPSTHNQRLRAPKTQAFENGPRSGDFLGDRPPIFLWSY